jgi:hypothetical protein
MFNMRRRIMKAIDPDVLNALVGKMLGDLGGAFSVPTVRIGYRLGLFHSLHADGSATAAQLAKRLGLAERYVREWALAQACNGYIEFDEASGQFSLSAEQAMVFAAEDSPVYLRGAFDLAAAMIEGEHKVEHGFRTGAGVAWGESAGCLFCAVGAFFRPGYVNSIVQAWLPAIEGMVARLDAGAKVADTGYDFHAPSIEQANSHALAHGVQDRVRFEVTPAKQIDDRGFDLVTMFDCLHDMGDPRGCAAHMRTLLKEEGCWMLVEPIAGDTPQIGSPVSRLYYNASTMICVPTSLAQEVGEALGAQAGEATLARVLREGGFRHVRRATEGPFNMVIEARP